MNSNIYTSSRWRGSVRKLLLFSLATAALLLSICTEGAQARASNCIPTAIIPYLQVDNGSWEMEAKATVAPGARLNLGPQPVEGGSWKWTGPNGFTSTSRENGNIALINGANVYTAVYTDTSGCVSTLNFTITVAAPSPSASQTGTPITPYMQVNGGAWDQVSNETVASGASVTLGPQPESGGSWSWSGTNGFTSRSREVYGVPLTAGANIYVATYTDPNGNASTAKFTITVH